MIAKSRLAYVDPGNGGDVTIEVSVDFPPGANMAALLVELGSQFVQVVEKVTESPEAEPVVLSDLSVGGSVADDILFWSMLGLPPERNNKLQPKQRDNNAHAVLSKVCCYGDCDGCPYK